MLILDLFKMAIRSLISHKLRTFLTALGIIIGVASVISMISIGEGARQHGVTPPFLHEQSDRRGKSQDFDRAPPLFRLYTVKQYYGTEIFE